MTRVDSFEWASRCVFGLTALVHVLPVAGLLGRSTIERAYGVSLGEGHDLSILLQHRALMFGLFAAACAAAVVWPAWRWPVAAAMLTSMWGFVLLAALQMHGLGVARVMWADLVCGMLMLAWLVWAWVTKD